MLSIIIPARNERYLNRTIQDLKLKATGEIEIIVVLDGADAPRLNEIRYIYHPSPIGMKYAINSAVALARGDYLMKIDAHCIVSPGFDQQLVKHHQPDWIQIPRRYKLNEAQWEPNFTEFIDYEYWIWPLRYRPASLHGFRWHERGQNRQDIKIDDTLTFQGSFWFMSRDHWDRHDFMHDEGYNELHAQEAVYLGNTTWMSGGRVVVNKHAWYCHLHGKRSYGINNRAREKCYIYSYKHWVLDHKEGFIKLIVKFWPLPNWPQNWQDKLWEKA